jgi:chromosome segregation ATPase
MAEINGDLIYEMLKRIQSDISQLKEGQRDLRQDNLSIRNQIHNMQGDINSLRASFSHMDDRMERIERRLELRELSERSQTPFDPTT